MSLDAFRRLLCDEPERTQEIDRALLVIASKWPLYHEAVDTLLPISACGPERGSLDVARQVLTQLQRYHAKPSSIAHLALACRFRQLALRDYLLTAINQCHQHHDEIPFMYQVIDNQLSLHAEPEADHEQLRLILSLRLELHQVLDPKTVAQIAVSKHRLVIPDVQARGRHAAVVAACWEALADWTPDPHRLSDLARLGVVAGRFLGNPLDIARELQDIGPTLLAGIPLRGAQVLLDDALQQEAPEAKDMLELTQWWSIS